MLVIQSVSDNHTTLTLHDTYDLGGGISWPVTWSWSVWTQAWTQNLTTRIDEGVMDRNWMFSSSGSRKERGLIEWSTPSVTSSTSSSATYDFPLGMGMVRRIQWLRRFPISPSFRGFRASDHVLTPEEQEGQERGGEAQEAADDLTSTKV